MFELQSGCVEQETITENLSRSFRYEYVFFRATTGRTSGKTKRPFHMGPASQLPTIQLITTSPAQGPGCLAVNFCLSSYRLPQTWPGRDSFWLAAHLSLFIRSLLPIVCTATASTVVY